MPYSELWSCKALKPLKSSFLWPSGSLLEVWLKPAWSFQKSCSSPVCHLLITCSSPAHRLREVCLTAAQNMLEACLKPTWSLLVEYKKTNMSAASFCDLDSNTCYNKSSDILKNAEKQKIQFCKTFHRPPSSDKWESLSQSSGKFDLINYWTSLSLKWEYKFQACFLK